LQTNTEPWNPGTLEPWKPWATHDEAVVLFSWDVKTSIRVERPSIGFHAGDGAGVSDENTALEVWKEES
jgi:hypothetical protein